MRLPIVDDSALTRKVTRLAFPSREHELHEAENGIEEGHVMMSEDGRYLLASACGLTPPGPQAQEHDRLFGART
jgi:hypothetical protein